MSNTLLTGRGTEQITVSTASIPFTNIPANATRALCHMSGADLNYENDGGDAATTNMIVRNGQYLNLTLSRHRLNLYRFIRNGSVDVTMTVQYFQ